MTINMADNNNQLMETFLKLSEQLNSIKNDPEFATVKKQINAKKREQSVKQRNELHKLALKVYRAQEADGTLSAVLKKYNLKPLA